MTAALGEALPVLAFLLLALAASGPVDRALTRWAARHGRPVRR